MHAFDHNNSKTCLGMFILQPLSSYNTMLKKGKKKAKAIGQYSAMEMLPRMEIIYEDTKAITGVEPEFKWGHIYQMIKDQVVPDAGLEEISLYVNIRKSAITKVATRLDLFPYAKVIRWILPRANAATMIMSNTEGKPFASFNPAYITKSCKLPSPQIHMTDEWIRNLD